MTAAGDTIRKILRDYGHDVLLQRKRDGKFLQKVERHTVRYMEPSARMGLNQQEQLEGITTDVDVVYWFLPNALPREGDRIWERDERYPKVKVDGKTFTNVTTWIIDFALPVRGEGGMVEFYACGSTRESPN